MDNRSQGDTGTTEAVSKTNSQEQTQMQQVEIEPPTVKTKLMVDEVAASIYEAGKKSVHQLWGKRTVDFISRKWSAEEWHDLSEAKRIAIFRKIPINPKIRQTTPNSTASSRVDTEAQKPVKTNLGEFLAIYRETNAKKRSSRRRSIL